MPSLSLALLASAALALAASNLKPNIIFIITDDQDSMLGATDVMPNYVQRFQTEGMPFVNAHVRTPAKRFDHPTPRRLTTAPPATETGGFTQVLPEPHVAPLGPLLAPPQ